MDIDNVPALGRKSRLKLEATVIATLLIFVIGLLTAAVLTGGRHALDAVGAIPLPIFSALLAMAGFNYVMRGLRWIVFSKAMHLVVPSALNALYYLAGFAMTTTPGKVGEAMRLWMLRRAHGYRYAATAGLLIADRLADAVSMIVLVALTVAGFSDYIWVSLIAFAAVAIVTVMFLRPVLLLQLVGLGYRMVGRFPRQFVGVRRSLRPLSKLASPRVFAVSLLLGVAGWFSEGMSLWLLLNSLGTGIPATTCVFIFAFSMIVGAISVLPGGLGSTEATMVGLLTLKGVPIEMAIVATAVVRVTTLWFAIGLGLLVLPVALHQVRLRQAVA